MPDCDYCEASFDDEDAYLSHLQDAHGGELSAIDQRRVESASGDGIDVPAGPIALVAIIGLAAAIVGYTVFAGGGGGDGQVPANIGPAGSAHYHGTINVTILGDTFDFSRAKWKHPGEHRRFHFEGRDDARWHAHATGMTLQYGLDTIGIHVTDDSVRYDGQTYVDGEGYDVTVQVNGNDVEPGAVLQDGDHIRIVVRQA